MAGNLFPGQIMKKLMLLCLSALFAVAMVGCSRHSPEERAERALPKISVTSMMVQISRTPAPNALIQPDGTLRIDDIVLPQSDEVRFELQQLFGHLQLQRQQALNQAVQDSRNTPVKLQSTPQIDELRDQLLKQVPPLTDYRESFQNLRGEWR